MASVTLPLRTRVPAYIASIATGALGTPAVVYLVAEHKIDTPSAVFLTAVMGAIHVLSGTFSLAHLSLPDDEPTTQVFNTAYVADDAQGSDGSAA